MEMEAEVLKGDRRVARVGSDWQAGSDRRRAPRPLRRGLNHYQLLLLGYAGITLLAAALFCLSISSASGKPQSFVDAIFVAASGISTTGLSVADPGSYYTLFGQIVLLADFQVGGIGYMFIYVLLARALGSRLSLKGQLTARESLAGPDGANLVPFFRDVVALTFVVEATGAALLTAYWSREFTLPRAIYLGVFHSISAFCTAGFSLFSTSLMAYQGSVFVNVVISATSIVGGIGFFVLFDVGRSLRGRLWGRRPGGRRHRLSLHSKLAISATAIVMAAGSLGLFLSANAASGSSTGRHAATAAFQAISASTTDGFNTVDTGSLSPTSQFILILLMLIGASPGSTGGGIKTTTAGVLLLYAWSLVRRREETNAFRRRIPQEVIGKCSVIVLAFLLVLVVDTIVMTATEKGSFLQIFFEISSALANAGLSTGITSSLSTIGRLLLTITMFIGRVGPLTVGLALVASTRKADVSYPAAEVFVG